MIIQQSKYFKNDSNTHMMLKHMNEIIYQIKNERICEYWKTHSLESKINIDYLYELFIDCLKMTIDKDPDEWINSLEAIERSKS